MLDKIKPKKIIPWLIGFSIAFLVLIIMAWLFLYIVYQDQICKNIYIDGVNVSNLDKKEALSRLHKISDDRGNIVASLQWKDNILSKNLTDLGYRRNYEDSVNQALKIGKSKNFLNDLKTLIYLIKNPININTQVLYDPHKIDNFILDLKSQVDIQGLPATYYLNQEKITSELEKTKLKQVSINGHLVFLYPGKDGQSLLIEESRTNLLGKITSPNLNQDTTIKAVVVQHKNTLKDDDINKSIDFIKNFPVLDLVFSYQEHEKIEISSHELIKLFQPPQTINQTNVAQFVNDLSQKIDRPPINAQFKFQEGQTKATVFQPDKDGLTLVKSQAEEKTLQLLDQILIATNTSNQQNPQDKGFAMKTISLETITQQAETTLAETNSLGINEQIGFGETYYDHSIPSRIYNVSLTADLLSGYIIKPGEEFSFNQALQEIDPNPGYKLAYIIRDGQTLLRPGGGVCQVSTTTFRALLDAGMKITRRLPHSYRVSYYELNKQPGFDATVYSGSTDLRFLNDTQHHILIQADADSEKLHMFVKLYGTDDGRSSEIFDYAKWGYSPPPPPVYIDDPSLPAGQIKRIEYPKASIKTKFHYLVKDKDGNVIQDKIFYSNYQAWGAKYLRGVD